MVRVFAMLLSRSVSTMYLVKDFYEEYQECLGLQLVAGSAGLTRKIFVPEAHRPGLGLAGFMTANAKKRMIIFGKAEIDYLLSLPETTQNKRMEDLLSSKTPAVIITRNFRPPLVIQEFCEKLKIPLFRVKDKTMTFLHRLTLLLGEVFAPYMHAHGSLIEVFGVGLLIMGRSGVGKSEAALGLIERKHRLVSDDLVKVKRLENNQLVGSGVEMTRHHMEIRGIGIINIANLYGIVSVREKVNIDIVVELEPWNDENEYDRIGLEDKTISFLNVMLPYHLLPIKPGRDVSLLLETIVLHHRLKEMGYHSAKELRGKLQESIQKKSAKS